MPMDQRFWKQKKMLPVYNGTDETIKPFMPVVFSGGADFKFTDEGEARTRFNDKVAWPVSGNIYPASSSYYNYTASSPAGASTDFGSQVVQPTEISAPLLALINGPHEIPPGGYGEASRDYPLPCLVDPDSFPIWSGNPDDPQTTGNYQAYLISGVNQSGSSFPSLGLRKSQVGQAFEPASFSPEEPLWSGLCWDVEPDGTQAQDRVLVTERPPQLPPQVAGGFFFISGGVHGATLTYKGQKQAEFTAPLDGLYTIDVAVEIEILTPGNMVNLAVGYTQGANAIKKTGVEIYNATGIDGVQTWVGWASRRAPSFAIDPLGGDPYTDPDEVSYYDFGHETMTIHAQAWAFKGDKFSIYIMAPGADTAVEFSNGWLNYRKVGELVNGAPGYAPNYPGGPYTYYNNWGFSGW